MKHLLPFILLLLFHNILFGQTKNRDLEIAKQIAANILNHNSYAIIDSATGKSFSESKSLKPDKKNTIESPYVEWKYWNGVLNLAMLEMYQITNNKKYQDYSVNNYQFVFDNLGFFEGMFKKGFRNTGMDKFFEMHMLDDCGAMGAGLLEVYNLDKRKDYRDYLDKAADFILNKEQRLEDGTLARLGPYNKTVWLDDLYMSIPFLVRYAKLTNDPKYLQFAAKQVIQFTKYLYDPYTGIYFHCYFDKTNENGVARWGRANGWSMMAQAHLLNAIPDDFSEKDTLLAIFRQQVNGLARYQSQSGLWHQLLDKPDSYLETSCSAMFCYAIAMGVNQGWLDEGYKTIAQTAWEGLKTKIQPDGQVQDICVGTWIKNDLVFYYNRPKQLNDIHGLGAVLLAAIEIVKLNGKK